MVLNHHEGNGWEKAECTTFSPDLSFAWRAKDPKEYAADGRKIRKHDRSISPLR